VEAFGVLIKFKMADVAVVEYNICKCITLVQYMSLSKDKCNYWSDQNTSWRSEISWVTLQIALGSRESAVTYIRFLGTSEYRMSHIGTHTTFFPII